MTREKKLSDWDELQRQLSEDPIPSEKSDAESSAKADRDKKKPGSKAKKQADRRAKPVAKKKPAAKVAEVLLDSDVSFESLSADLVDAAVAAASMTAKKTKKVAQEEEEAPKPKRRRRKPATLEEEREEEQKDAEIGGILARVVEGKEREAELETIELKPAVQEFEPLVAEPIASAPLEPIE